MTVFDVKRGAVAFVVAQHGVQDSQQLARGGDECDQLWLTRGDQFVRNAFSTGLCRAATMAAMNKAARTRARPPPMKLLPFHWPD